MAAKPIARNVLAQLQPGDQRRGGKRIKPEPEEIELPPAPVATPSSAGNRRSPPTDFGWPSGQKEEANHDRKHANK